MSRTTSASRADRVEEAALLGDRAGDPALVGERVAVARLAEAPDQDVVARLEEDDLRPDAATLERAAHRGERERRVAGPDVEDDRDPREALAVGRDELGQVGQQLAGQVVDDGVAEVLEELGRGGLAAAGQAAQDDDVLVGGSVDRIVGRRPAAIACGSLRPVTGRLRRDEQDVVSSNRTYIVAAEDERADEVAAGRRDRREDRDARGSRYRRDDAQPLRGDDARPATGRRAGSGTP